MSQRIAPLPLEMRASHVARQHQVRHWGAFMSEITYGNLGYTIVNFLTSYTNSSRRHFWTPA